MANEKQAGTNIINAEYSTGRCGTKCEQCFVNFGPRGNSQTRATANLGRRPTQRHALEQAKKYGLYKPPKEVPADLVVPEGYERLRWEINERGGGFYEIPMVGAWEDWIVKERVAKCRRFEEVEGLESMGAMPTFLRVSSMSDAARAPAEWVRKVREAWGDYCFFNAAIRSLRWAKKNNPTVLNEFHKLVVTLNGGQQAPPPMRPAVMRTRDSKADEEVKKAWTRFVKKNRTNRGTMKGKPGQVVRGDFLHPLLPRDIGLEELEQTIKFYRLRALATVRGPLPDDIDNPVVITMMRFKGFDNVCEFARRYNLILEFYVSSISKIPAYVLRDFKNFKVNINPKQGKSVITFRTKRDDPRNFSRYAGEESSFEYIRSYFRPLDIDAFNDDPHVCDRLHGNYTHCGLCASLDGQGLTIEGVPYCNPLNVAPNGRLMAPLPYGRNAGYLGSFSTDGGSDVFAKAMRELGFPVDVPEQYSDWRQNPYEADPATIDEVRALFADVAAYIEGIERFADDWNTHENVEMSRAFGVWSILTRARAEGMSKARAYELVFEIAHQSTGGVDIMDGIDDLFEIWDGNTLWNEEFGPV